MQTARLSLRGGGGAFVGLVFFLAVVTVVPFGVGPDLKLLARIGPAILWIGALLATLLGLDRLFRDDHEDGSLDLLVLDGPAAGSWWCWPRRRGVARDRPAAGDRRRRCSGCCSAVEPAALGVDDADAAGRHAGADADRRHRRGADHRRSAAAAC